MTVIFSIIQNGLTALHYAARYGKTDVVKFLCENGADITARETDVRRLL